MPETAPPILSIIAGPNGSGKSTFFDRYLRQQVPVFVNADEIARSLGHLPEDIRQLAAAEQATDERLRLLRQGHSFAFETVFSRPDYWLEFIRSGKNRGYYVRLHFLCTEAPALNVARVAERVDAGGHAVPTAKIASRYPGSIRTAVLARTLVDEMWLYDNSRLDESPLLVARFIRGKADYLSPTLPRWAQVFFRDEVNPV